MMLTGRFQWKDAGVLVQNDLLLVAALPTQCDESYSGVRFLRASPLADFSSNRRIRILSLFTTGVCLV